VRGTKERSFSGKFTGNGAGKTEPDSSGWKREAAASRINQKRATRVKPSRPYFFGGRKEKDKALPQSSQRKGTEVTEKSERLFDLAVPVRVFAERDSGNSAEGVVGCRSGVVAG
jgi:hypothetical protein